MKDRWWIKPALVGAAFLIVLAGPFLLRPGGATNSRKADATVIIVTPHAESIRYEFARAFAAHMKETTGKTVHVDWRTPGSGTSEIEKYLRSSFRASFQDYCSHVFRTRRPSFHNILFDPDISLKPFMLEGTKEVPEVSNLSRRRFPS